MRSRSTSRGALPRPRDRRLHGQGQGDPGRRAVPAACSGGPAATSSEKRLPQASFVDGAGALRSGSPRWSGRPRRARGRRRKPRPPPARRPGPPEPPPGPPRPARASPAPAPAKAKPAAKSKPAPPPAKKKPAKKAAAPARKAATQKEEVSEEPIDAGFSREELRTTPRRSAASSRESSRRSSRSRRSRSSRTARPTCGAAPSTRSRCSSPSARRRRSTRPKGHPIVYGRFERGPELPDGHRLQPPRRPAGRGAGLEDAALRLHQERATVPRARHDRRQGAGDHGALRRALRVRAGRPAEHPLPLGARGGDRQPALRDHDPRERRRNSRPTRSSSPTRSGSRARARPARRACAACRDSASSSQTGETDQHSGTAGGAARNPVTEMCQLIAECVDGKTGRVKIPGFYTDVVPPTKKELEDLKNCGFTVEGLQEGPPVQVAPRRRRARGHEADLDDADLRGPRHRRRLPGPGRQDDHPAQGDGDRLLPPRAEHEPEEDREARDRLREEEEPRREGLRPSTRCPPTRARRRARTPTRSAAR